MFFYDVIPMQDCHIMLGHPWQFNKNEIHDSRKNDASFELNNRKYILAPLTPSQIYEDQKRVREAIKEFERENNERSKKECMLTFRGKMRGGVVRREWDVK